MWRLAEEVCEGPQGAAAMRLLLPSPRLKAALKACVESIPQSCRDITDGAQAPAYHMVRASSANATPGEHRTSTHSWTNLHTPMYWHKVLHQ
jgi:thiamine monophosphate kinase